MVFLFVVFSPPPFGFTTVKSHEVNHTHVFSPLRKGVRDVWEVPMVIVHLILSVVHTATVVHYTTVKS